MIIVLKPEATPETVEALLARISERGLTPLHMPGVERVVLGALGDERVLAELNLDSHPMVESVKPILAPYKLVSRELHPHDTIVKIGGVAIGGRAFAVIAGPCAVESLDQTRNTAELVKAAGAVALRAGLLRQGGGIAHLIPALDGAGPRNHREASPADRVLAEANDRVVRMHLPADELVGRQDRLHRFHHRMSFERQLGEHPLVAEGAEHDALGAGHVERLQPLRLDLLDQLAGGFGGGFGLENDDHEGCPKI